MDSIYEVSTGDFIDIDRLVAIKKPQVIADAIGKKSFVVGVRILMYFQLQKEPIEIFLIDGEIDRAEEIYQEIVGIWKKYKGGE